MKHSLIIIGGGASGLTSALIAKDFGIDVAIIEGTDRVGKKILTTGNGRCNISNVHINNDRYHSENPNFAGYTLDSFTIKDTINFFECLGIPLVTKDGGKMFPMSLQASSVLDILRFAIDEKKIPLYTNTKAKEIIKTNKGFKVYSTDNSTYECERLIIATGGKSAPKTGSDGSGYSLARQLGHSIISPVPALVQLKLNYNKLKALSGVKFDGFAEIFINDKYVQKEFGEILFTDYGISGPPILQLSRTASYGLSKNSKVSLSIDMLPNISYEDLKAFLNNHWSVFPSRCVHDSFIGIINKKIIPIILKEANIDDIHKPCCDLASNEKNALYTLLKRYQFDVSGTNSFANAQITAGGINTKEINPETLESNITKNLFFAGEILDVDGDCGGFNLQWAWSSGAIAGINASK
ncbi:NAD(P)/FAD-dependent oxidoreductase [Clostridium sp. CM028]|uniref:NAD(P)/FAD-dependent oxidoreductase n=1 Tax=unclassified Clostridium TaxID=2614128 RepID=UPI001C0AD85E|nr:MULTISPECIES: NAD(P)/FAD-dependent oxidoreductase [unclassified Clostridium]MBU3091125.1 NAD(P)/FAD-dependent oxidoreductase [Clostridium sp. CF011]MBW9144893.1 NAD(P)/FAD-dependent oxidoreductase [Clostridium sp. CM027]MBW9148688.1 NAD(P)/FAD-dependent oxidoreductase [Clostridium sp. CM028]UVE40035.1 NAD(P)/FAD-dependent oxidoreductase [Clostridium sp. CM027]WAG68959.1 NAD(P)/FAD-dependent oxidoreductase [Clostridium sp. CF011]